MKKNMFFWIMALMICAAVGCADNSTYEPEKLPTPKKLSHEVTQAEARQSLEKIIADMKLPSTRGGEQKSLPPITSVYTTGKPAEATRSGEVEPYFHIFNFGNNEGFAIMSGDDRVEPLLALTFKGELTPETEIDNPGFKIAYSKMEDYYIAKTMGGPSVSPDIPIPPRDSIDHYIVVRTTEEVSTVYHNMPMGFCPVKWGQQGSYNTYCFTSNGLEAATGCVATAVAQLMAMYKYPNSYNGYTFNWSDMIQAYPSATGIDQIARLMQQLGTTNNLNVDYGVSSSSANPENIPRTLRHFGYTNGGTLASYITNDVITELKAGYPVLIGGRDGNDTGHRWLGHGCMDRYRTICGYNIFDELVSTASFVDRYILCNFGWYGNADGYYLSMYFDTNIGPDYPESTRSNSTDNDYSNSLTVVKGIRK